MEKVGRGAEGDRMQEGQTRGWERKMTDVAGVCEGEDDVDGAQASDRDGWERRGCTSK